MFHDRKFHKSKLIAQGMPSVFELLFMKNPDRVKLSGADHLALLTCHCTRFYKRSPKNNLKYFLHSGHIFSQTFTHYFNRVGANALVHNDQVCIIDAQVIEL